MPIHTEMRVSKNARRGTRTKCSVPVILAWSEEEGTERLARGTCIEISSTGIRVALPHPIPYLAYVTLRLGGPGLAVSGRVRHVRRTGLNAIVGLELRQPLNPEVLKAATPGFAGVSEKE